MIKQELLNQIAATHLDAIRELEAVDPLRVVYEESGWRVKDVVGHVVTWESEYLRSLHAFKRGGEYAINGWRGDDDFNGYAATRRMDEPMANFFTEWRSLRNWLGILVRPMTDEQLDTELLFPDHERATARQLLIDILEHQAEHMEDIRAALARTTESSDT